LHFYLADRREKRVNDTASTTIPNHQGGDSAVVTPLYMTGAVDL
jgi:hypothetical protein